MNSMNDFISQKDEIDRLNKQLDMVAGFYNKQIQKLNKKVLSERASKNRFKSLCGKDKLKSALTRSEKAKLLIVELKGTGKPSLLMKDIASKCYLSELTVNKLWYAA